MEHFSGHPVSLYLPSLSLWADNHRTSTLLYSSSKNWQSIYFPLQWLTTSLFNIQRGRLRFLCILFLLFSVFTVAVEDLACLALCLTVLPWSEWWSCSSYYLARCCSVLLPVLQPTTRSRLTGVVGATTLTLLSLNIFLIPSQQPLPQQLHLSVVSASPVQSSSISGCLRSSVLPTPSPPNCCQNILFKK